MRLIAAVLTVLLASGCLCCTGDYSFLQVGGDEPPERIYYCEWSWPQKIIDWETKDALYVCPARRPYCNVDSAEVGVKECCKYDSAKKEYHDCMQI